MHLFTQLVCGLKYFCWMAFSNLSISIQSIYIQLSEPLSFAAAIPLVPRLPAPSADLHELSVGLRSACQLTLTGRPICSIGAILT